MHLWNSPAITMILSLTLHVEQSPNKFAQNNSPPYAIKSFPPYFMERDTMPLLHWKIMWGCLAQYLQESAE